MDIFTLYRRFSEIKSSCDFQEMRKGLDKLSDYINSSGLTRDMILNEISRLMASLNFAVDSRQFTCFYDFVFLICRENKQKSISVSMAVDAWRLVLNGRFRILDQWCDFVEARQRHNISKDTWQQVLAFSRSVHEDLQGYDLKGAWPVLIDDFVEHMYRITQCSECCSSKNTSCNCGDIERQLQISDAVPRLIPHPGSKRKALVHAPTHEVQHISLSDHYNVSSLNKVARSKRFRQVGAGNYIDDKNDITANHQAYMSRQYYLSNCSNNPSCGIKGALSSSIEGFLSPSNTFQLGHGQRVSYTNFHS